MQVMTGMDEPPGLVIFGYQLGQRGAMVNRDCI
jgi:hypothetical protein